VYLAPATSTNPTVDGAVLGQQTASGGFVAIDGNYTLTLQVPEIATHNSTLFVFETYYHDDTPIDPFKTLNTTFAINLKF
jgi:hypothetical protein